MGRRKSNKLSNLDRVRIHRRQKKIEQTDRDLVNLRIQELINVQTNIQTNVSTPQSSNKPILKIGLQNWASEFRISKRAVDSLLGLLNSTGFKDLPKNHRTLQGTPIHVPITDTAGGKMWFNGLNKCLRSTFSNLDRNLNIGLNFNIDGLPLFNSSKISFCPILASIHSTCVKLISKKSF